MKKKWVDRTEEEKNVERASKKKSLEKKAKAQAETFADLRKQLITAKVSKDILAIVDKLESLTRVRMPGTAPAVQYESAFEKLFGKGDIKVGATNTYNRICIRGKNGERLNVGESLGAFETRVGEENVITKYAPSKVNDFVKECIDKGYDVFNDKQGRKVEYRGLVKKAASEAAKA